MVAYSTPVITISKLKSVRSLVSKAADRVRFAETDSPPCRTVLVDPELE